MALLEIKNLTKAFGGLIAVHDLTLDVHKGEILGLIGPNGAGKTTVFNMVSGMFPCTRGKINYNGKDIKGLNMYQIASKGLVRTFQLPTLFNNFTVFKNVLMGMHLHAELTLWGVLFNTASRKRRDNELLHKADAILQDVGLADRKDALANTLPHGHRRILQLAISLGCEPGLLLMDEPMTGMNVQEVEEMMALIRKLRERRGITMIVVEHNIRAVMRICDRIAVLNFGTKIAEGTPEEISKNEAVIQAYLGAQHEDARS